MNLHSTRRAAPDRSVPAFSADDLALAAASLPPPSPSVPRTPLRPVFVINLVCGLFIAGILFYEVLGAFWRIGFVPTSIKCLPGTVFVIRTAPPDTIRHGQLISFRARGLAPLLPDHTRLVKIAAGLPGDRVEVTPDGIFINGIHWGPLNGSVLKKSGNTHQSVTRTFTIPDGELLLLGTLPRSYDGRYWGTVKDDQVIGQAWMVF